MDEPASASPRPAQVRQFTAFWTTAEYKGGFLQGMGVGFLLAGFLLLIRFFPTERLGPLGVVLGVVLIVAGGLQARSMRSRNPA